MPGLYFHIPFCKQACHYCDFHFTVSDKNKSALIQTIGKEVELRKEYLPAGSQIETIYFGGGTPSLLSREELDLLLETVYKHFQVSPEAEITLEANPDDLTREKLHDLRHSAVNRLSIGIQSFDDAELTWMNRAHTSAMALASVRDAQEAGFHNISIDLIYGSPLLKTPAWMKTLETAFKLDVQHLSCYNLTVEEKTVLAFLIKKGKTMPPDENRSLEQFRVLMEMAGNYGFEHYEISNFARPGFNSRHNSSYWSEVPYLGLGPSAHSFDGTSRQWNVSNNAMYLQEITAGTVPFTREALTDTDRYNEYIMTALRTSRGIDRNRLTVLSEGSFLPYFSDRVKRYIESGEMTVSGTFYFLTRKGKIFADRIAADLFFA